MKDLCLGCGKGVEVGGLSRADEGPWMHPNIGCINKLYGRLQAEIAAQAALSAKLVADRDALALEVKEAREVILALSNKALRLGIVELEEQLLRANAFLSRSPGAVDNIKGV